MCARETNWRCARLPLVMAVLGLGTWANGTAEAVAAEKSNTFKDTKLDGDLNDATVTVTWKHHGDKPGCSLDRSNLEPAHTFALGVGEADSVSDELCGGKQVSSWDVESDIYTDSSGREYTEIHEKGDKTDDGFVKSEAVAPDPGPNGTSHSSSTTTLTFAGITASASAEESRTGKDIKKDDAVVGGPGSLFSSATGRFTVKSDGVTIVEVYTYIWAGGGGMSSVVLGEGLKLPTGVGSWGGFISRVINTQHPEQNFEWYVMARDGVLSGPGAANGAWASTGSGWFLPDADFAVGDDITYTLASDSSFEVENESTATDEAASATTVSVVAASPPNGLRDVLQNTTTSLDPQGIGVPGTPNEGAVGYQAISVLFSDTPSPLPAPGTIFVDCTATGSSQAHCPAVISTTGNGAGPYHINLTGPIPAGACMTMTFAGAAPDQKLKYQSLPGDMNLNGISSAQDVLTLVAGLNNGSANNNLARFDVNRSGSATGQDALRLVQLLNGTNTTQAFNGATVAPCP